MGSGLERGRLRGGAVRRALQGLATDMRAALGSRLTDQMLSARLNTDGWLNSGEPLKHSACRSPSLPRLISTEIQPPDRLRVGSRSPWGWGRKGKKERGRGKTYRKREGEQTLDSLWLFGAGRLSLVWEASRAMLLGGDGTQFLPGGGGEDASCGYNTPATPPSYFPTKNWWWWWCCLPQCSFSATPDPIRPGFLFSRHWIIDDCCGHYFSFNFINSFYFQGEARKGINW